MKKIIEFDEKCPSCNGTGLYVGMAERDGYAVICYTCKGTGKHHFTHTYEEFEKREEREDIRGVVQTNPGICLGGNYDFGGMSYQDWKEGKPFIIGMEMRLYTCPSWWYQSADYKKKPEWKECGWGGSFSDCKHFSTKSICWEKWDKEFNK